MNTNKNLYAEYLMFPQHDEMIAYDLNNIIKEYARFPKFLPGGFYSEHGFTYEQIHSPTELETKQKLFLVFNKKRENQWKKQSSIPVATVGAPFVHFRRKRKIEIDKEAKGTVAFPVHSGTILTSEFDYSDYAKDLLSLPDAYHPISICLHSDDIRRGRDKWLSEFNIEIVCAGHRYDRKFPTNFYNILRKHRYATSNGVGTHLYYAIEMGLPFFILGDVPIFINHDKKIETLVPEKYNQLQYEYGRVCYELFDTVPTKTITPDQKAFVEAELGINDCISPAQLNRILWKIFFRYGLYKYSKRTLKKNLKKGFCQKSS